MSKKTRRQVDSALNANRLYGTKRRLPRSRRSSSFTRAGILRLEPQASDADARVY
jgi:hypothetical protein